MESYPGGAGTDAPDLNDEFENIISREFGMAPSQTNSEEFIPFGDEFMRDAPPDIKGLGSVKHCGTVLRNGGIDNRPDGTD